MEPITTHSKEPAVITLTVLVASLAAGHGLVLLWNKAAVALAAPAEPAAAR